MDSELDYLIEKAAQLEKTYGFYYEGTYILIEEILQSLVEIYFDGGGWSEVIKGK